jgi:hypothetical protein
VREILDDTMSLNIVEGRQTTLAAYADDVIIIGETEVGLRRMEERLISKGKDIGLQANVQKT